MQLTWFLILVIQWYVLAICMSLLSVSSATITAIAMGDHDLNLPSDSQAEERSKCIVINYFIHRNLFISSLLYFTSLNDDNWQNSQER